jgi:hypothetical protein
MILASELLAMTADQVAAALRGRAQRLAEKPGGMSREERGELLRETHQLRQRYIYLRGGMAAAVDLA